MDSVYKTSDLTEILFLMCRDRSIVRTEREGQRITFVFDDADKQCDGLMKEYILGHDQVSVSRLLIERQKALRLITIS